MATITVSCPKCETAIKVPAVLDGKKIRCKECKHVFTVKAPPGAKAAKPDAKKGAKPDKKAVKEKEAAAKTQAQGEDDDANPYKVTEHDFLPRCAFCAKEMESEDQIICLNCGYNHQTRELIQTQKTYEPTGGEWFIHLLPGIICALFFLLCVADIFLTWIGRVEREAAYGADSWFNPHGLGISIWRTVIKLFIMFFLGKFAIKRLILHPRPPERKMVARKKD